MVPLKDQDKMPWGRHRGTPMEKVPADYFHYMWTTGKKNETTTCPVAAYIMASMGALKLEKPDAIW